MNNGKFFRFTLVISLLGIFAFVLVMPDQARPETVLKLSTHSPGPGTPRTDYLVRFKKAVEKRTGGEVKVKIFWANSLVHAKELLEATQVGTVDLADLPVSYFSDKLRLIQVASLPFSVSDEVEQRDGLLRVIKKVPQVVKELERFKHVLLAVTATSSYQLPSRSPIRNLADLQGKKVGTFGKTLPKVIQASGARPVSISGGEMYEALQRGTIDARALSYESSKRFKLYEVAKYMSDVNLGMVAGVNLLSINQDIWKSLSSANQKILLEEGKKAGEWEAQAMKDGNAVFKEFLEKKGMKMIKFSSKDREKWKGHPNIKAIADQWVASMEKKGLPGKRVLSIFLGK
ncbi:MAG: C4-dicarboxylate TRAP transporter substrate-binding protein [Desulfatiglandales bacterium]